MPTPSCDTSGGIQWYKAKIAAETIVMIVTMIAKSLPTRFSSSTPARGLYRLVGRRLEGEIRLRGSPAGDRDFLCRRTKLFLPRGQRVLSGRQSLQAELAVVIGHRIVRRPEHGEISMHPGMNIALHGNDLRLLISDLDWRGARRLRPVPLGIQLRHRVNVVRSLVVILDFEWLIYFHCGDVWDVLTPFLIVDDRLRCRGALITRRHVDDDIFESVSGTDADGFCHDRRGG